MFRWTMSRLKAPERTRVRILLISVRVAPFRCQMFHCDALPFQVRLCTHSQRVLGSDLWLMNWKLSGRKLLSWDPYYPGKPWQATFGTAGVLAEPRNIHLPDTDTEGRAMVRKASGRPLTTNGQLQILGQSMCDWWLWIRAWVPDGTSVPLSVSFERRCALFSSSAQTFYNLRRHMTHTRTPLPRAAPATQSRFSLQRDNETLTCATAAAKQQNSAHSAVCRHVWNTKRYNSNGIQLRYALPTFTGFVRLGSDWRVKLGKLVDTWRSHALAYRQGEVLFGPPTGTALSRLSCSS